MPAMPVSFVMQMEIGTNSLSPQKHLGMLCCRGEGSHISCCYQSARHKAGLENPMTMLFDRYDTSHWCAVR